MKRYTFLQLFKNKNGSNVIPTYDLVNNTMGSLMLPSLSKVSFGMSPQHSTFILSVPLNCFLKTESSFCDTKRCQMLGLEEAGHHSIKKYMDL